MNKKYWQNQKNGFALIYTLLFITLLLTAASATWLTGLADLRLSQRSSYSVQSSELAKSAVDMGWSEYKIKIDNKVTYTDSEITFPSTNACLTTNRAVHRIDLSTNPPTSSDTTLNFANNPSIIKTSAGVYDYNVCTISGVTKILGIGYYKGSKITLEGQVTHNHGGAANLPVGCNNSDPLNLCTGLDHSDDYLTISQTGPSQ
ncbi:MAG: hypothetical protein M1429_01600 [Patescibacteria group bacterium]|nr:hypothetical protein [Patescibacteria group bacterium]